MVALIVLAPFAWLLISSVADPRDLLARPLRWLPEHVSLDLGKALDDGGRQCTLTDDPGHRGFRGGDHRAITTVVTDPPSVPFTVPPLQ